MKTYAEIASSSEADELDPIAVAEVVRAQKQLRRRLKVVGVILAAAIGFLLYKTLTSAVTYFKTVDQAIAARSVLGSSTFQLEGLVVSGTISRPNSTTVDFTVSGSRGHRIEVVSTRQPPQLFQANIPVVMVGHFSVSGSRFVTDQILVKHSNSYIAAHPNRVRASNGSVR